jgi:CRISPR system Cascade subunit CasE
MLYLTRARLSADIRVGALLPLLRPREDDVSRTHHLVWSLMSDGPGRERDFLFRQGDDGALYVQGERAPEVSPLWASETMEVPDYQTSDRVQFMLRFSPVVRRKRPDGRTIKRDPILERLAALPPEERHGRRYEVAATVARDWLGRLGTSSGYELESLTLDAYRQERVRRSNGAALISIADVSGILRITNAAAFAARLRDGVGTARAWGCGLMLTRRIGPVR